MSTAPAATSPTPVAALLRALLDAWCQACRASALWHEARRAVQQATPVLRVAPARPGGEALSLDLAALCASPWVRPKGLELSFDVRLRPQRGGGWVLVIVGPQRWWHGPGAARHRVVVRLGGLTQPRAELFFDGEPWRTLVREPVDREAP